MFYLLVWVFFSPHKINNHVFRLTAVLKVCRNEMGTGVGGGRKFPNLGCAPCPLWSVVHFSGKHPVIDAGSESKGAALPA